MTRPRVKSIIAACHRQGAYLRKAHVKHANGRGGADEYFIEPGALPVRRKYAEEAIRSGWLIPRDFGLFGDDPQTWIVAR